MRLKSLIYMLEYINNYGDESVRYIECKSADAIEVVFDDNSALRLEWVNGTDICVFKIVPDRNRIDHHVIEDNKEADDDKR